MVKAQTELCKSDGRNVFHQIRKISLSSHNEDDKIPKVGYCMNSYDKMSDMSFHHAA
jgi:hypothetical protein